MISERKTDVLALQGLCRDIEARAGEMGLPLERCLIDVAVWYFRNKGRLAPENVVKRLQFLEKTVECMMEMNALLVDRLHQAEGRKNAPNILIPRLQLEGDLTKLG